MLLSLKARGLAVAPKLGVGDAALGFWKALDEVYLGKAESGALINAKAFLTLYTLAVMHGSSIILESGQKARLFAGYANRDRRSEVKIDLALNELSKRVLAPICLFLTHLLAESHCDRELLVSHTSAVVGHWDFPIDVVANGQLVRIDSSIV